MKRSTWLQMAPWAPSQELRELVFPVLPSPPGEHKGRIWCHTGFIAPRPVPGLGAHKKHDPTCSGEHLGRAPHGLTGRRLEGPGGRALLLEPAIPCWLPLPERPLQRASPLLGPPHPQAAGLPGAVAWGAGPGYCPALSSRRRILEAAGDRAHMAPGKSSRGVSPDGLYIHLLSPGEVRSGGPGEDGATGAEEPPGANTCPKGRRSRECGP